MAALLRLPETHVTAPTRRQRGVAWRQLSLKAKVGAGICGFFVLMAVFGPLFEPYDPASQNQVGAAGAPSLQHLLGTTSLGQDVLSQLLAGTRATLLVGVGAAVIATALSIVFGITAGYLGAWWDEGLSLFTNVVLVLPALPLLIVLLGYLPKSGITSTILVLGLLGWPWGARVIRAQTLSLRTRDFVAAARETGESSARLIFFEILPNEVSLIAASFVSTVLYAVGTSVALAYLGLYNVDSQSLGTMLYWAQNQNAIFVNAWWWFVPPGIFVALLGAGLVLLNFGIDELGNPRLREAAGANRIDGRRWRPADPTPVSRSLGAGGSPR